MRMLDAEKQTRLYDVQLYLTPEEARELRENLEKLLRNPDAKEHAHLISDGGEMSFSLMTQAKLQDMSAYTAAERKLFGKK